MFFDGLESIVIIYVSAKSKHYPNRPPIELYMKTIDVSSHAKSFDLHAIIVITLLYMRVDVCKSTVMGRFVGPRHPPRDRRGRIVGFATTCAISAYYN